MPGLKNLLLLAGLLFFVMGCSNNEPSTDSGLDSAGDISHEDQVSDDDDSGDDDSGDDDIPNVSLVCTPSSTFEAGGAINCSLIQSSSTNKSVRVKLTYSGTATAGTDYSGNHRSRTITKGQISTSWKLIGKADSNREGNETIVIKVDSVTNAKKNGAKRARLILEDTVYDDSGDDDSGDDDSGDDDSGDDDSGDDEPVPTYTIIASVQSGGCTVSPLGSISIDEGSDKTFTISVNLGVVKLLQVDGAPQQCEPLGCSYTFFNVTEDHSIDVMCS